MEKEFLSFDSNGNKVYLIIETGNYNKNLINCYAYRKKIKFKIFNFKEFINNTDSDLFDKRCNSFILASEINEKNIDEKINYLLDNVLCQVNKVIEKENNIKKSLKLVSNYEI